MTGKFDGAVYKGDDTDEDVVGSDAYEVLFGKGGKDSLDGAGGNDVIFGGYGTDLLHGGTGDDYLFGNESYIPGSDGDTLYGDAGNDRLLIGASHDSHLGGVLDGGTDDDTAEIFASGYNQTTNTYDTVTFALKATAAGSSVRIGATDTVLVRNIEHLVYYGDFGKDVVTGGALSDEISGGGGDDVLKGGAGDDYLDGGAGNDRLDGGAGFDVASVDLSDAAAEVILVAGGTIVTGPTKTLSNIEAFATVFTGSGNDTISVGSVEDVPPEGDAAASSYKGRTYVDAGVGNDTITGGNRQDEVFGGTGADRIDGGSGNDRLYVDDGEAAESAGKTSNDTAHGGDGDDTLVGGWGRDVLYGDGGDDTLTYTVYGSDSTVDVFNGGSGDDRLIINGTSGASSADITLGASTALKLDGDTVVTASSVEALSFNDYSDATITIAAGDLSDFISLSGASTDVVTTLGGDDTVQSSGGTDTIDAGAGNDLVGVSVGGRDMVRAGSGDDRLSIQDMTTEPNGGRALYDAGSGDDTLIYSEVSGGSFDGTYIRHGNTIVGRIVNYEHLNYFGSGQDTTFAGTDHDDKIYMGRGADTASGGIGNDLIRGGAGSDVLDGGVGTDTLDYGDKAPDSDDNPAPNLTITLKGTAISKVVVSATETDSVKNFENVVGGHGDDTITGTAGANVLDGGGGNDVLKGLGGADTFAFKQYYTASEQPDPGITRIADFASDDALDLSLERFAALTGNTTTGELTAGQFKDLSKASADANDRILYDRKTGFLFYDADGSGPVSTAAHFATLDTKAALTSHDIFVV